MKIATYRSNRRCLNCGVPLSKFNPDICCALHTPKMSLDEAIKWANTAGCEKRNDYQPRHSARPVHRICL